MFVFTIDPSYVHAQCTHSHTCAHTHIHTHSHTNKSTVESRDYAPSPFVHARIGQNWGGGLYAGSLYFRVITITDRRMPRGSAISPLPLAVW